MLLEFASASYCDDGWNDVPQSSDALDFALKGAAKLIEKHKPTVVSEINPWFVEGFGLTVQQLVSFFTDQGYKLYRYENKKLIETPIEKVVEDNWVFVHPSRMDRFRSILAPSA